MSTTTKDGIEVKVGQVWEDLDPRMRGKRVKVTDVWVGSGHYAGVWFATVYPVLVHRPGLGYSRASKIRINRMHIHSTGWKLIKDA